MNPKKVLALSPHPDDIEFGCGGLLHSFIERKIEVHTIVFSNCEQSVPDGLPKNVLINEMYQAAGVLGIPAENIILLDIPVRNFPEHRQEILEQLVKFNRKHSPDLILTPSSFDIHQDHNTVHIESLRAFKYHTILGYEIPWNNVSFNANGLFELREGNINKKIAALSCYESQKFRHYSNPNYIKNHAQLRGLQQKTTYSEAFEIIRYSG